MDWLLILEKERIECRCEVVIGIVMLLLLLNRVGIVNVSSGLVQTLKKYVIKINGKV